MFLCLHKNVFPHLDHRINQENLNSLFGYLLGIAKKIKLLFLALSVLKCCIFTNIYLLVLPLDVHGGK